MKPTELRKDLYRVLDEVLLTGMPVEIERNGRILLLAPLAGGDRLSHLRPHPTAVSGEIDDLDGIGWEDSWRP
ncbi:MAG: hypothetical protein ACI80V_003563 [Rhodothermales bacterium]|jgi:hypothetical protein